MNAASIIASTYQDQCDIYRNEKVLQGNITRNELQLKYQNIKCALSQKNANVTVDNVAKLVMVSKLFISPTTDLVEGDVVIVTQFGSDKKMKFIVENLFFYAGSHQEVALKRAEYE